MAAEFTHLHLHTDYSLLDGACDVDKLAAHLSKSGQTSAAITDHGNIFGAVHFFEAMKKKKLHPILGCELYICKEEDHRRESADPDSKYNHLLVLAENEAGYRNLIRLTSEAALHGFYKKPRISKNFLAKHTEGLIGFSGCLAGEVSQHVIDGSYDKAKKTAGDLETMFGRGNFFLEIQDHGLGPDKAVTEAMFRLEKDLDIPLIATNDSHYIEDQDSRAHEILLCVQTAGSMNDPKHFKFDSNEFYIKSAEEMHRLFRHAAEVCTRTMQFPERCQLEMRPVENPFPHFDCPDGMDLDAYFEQVCRAGWRHRRETAVKHLETNGKLRKTLAEYEARLTREIETIKQMKFPGYFMIVWDFMRYAREQNIPVGPGRGSAAGSLVAYVMEITDIDPLQNDLLFERFLNPERISMPDIDIDFCMNRRGEVIEYVRRKYGNDQVAQIITFNTMASKAAIKDVGRVLEMPYGEVDRIAKLIPTSHRNEKGDTVVGCSIDQALKDSPPLAQAYAEPKIKELIDTALRLEGLVRGAGVHAAGVVIAPQPLTELVPVTRTKDEAIVTSYDMKAVEKMGLLKMDFLGLTTLTVIDDCLKLIQSNRGEAVDLALIDLDDQTTFEKVFHRALTSGVFQFESGGMRDVLRRYKPSSVEHLTALNALYRPGPMSMIDDFIERKWGRKEVQYQLPELEPLLKETLGVMVYQEQVMQISNVIGGYSLGAADLLRRAMGKKDAAEMARQREIFMAGANERGFPKAKAGEIFDQMEKFAGYGFNKSHSAAYSLLAYHTAWLKTHYPVEFMAALLTSETSKPENVVKYISECREMSIAVVPPDVQISSANFTPADGAIRFGLAAIKNVGHNAIESILKARESLQAKGKTGFESLWQFCEEVDLRLMNKRVLESLCKAGALDSFGKRSQVMAALDKAMERAQKSQKDAAAGQHGLFGMFDDEPASAAGKIDDLPAAPEWDEHTRLQNEKEVLGFFVSGHPLDRYREKLRNMKVVDTVTACEMKPEPQQFRRGQQEQANEIQIAGVITGLKVAKSKRGEMYAQASLEDTVGKIELIAFSSSYEKLAEKLKIDVPVLVRGTLRGDDDAAPKLSISNIQALEDIKIKLPDALRINVPLHHPDAELLSKLESIFRAAPGSGKLLLNLEEPGEFCAVLEPGDLKVSADVAFIENVETLLGRGAVQIIN